VEASTGTHSITYASIVVKITGGTRRSKELGLLLQIAIQSMFSADLFDSSQRGELRDIHGCGLSLLLFRLFLSAGSSWQKSIASIAGRTVGHMVNCAMVDKLRLG